MSEQNFISLQPKYWTTLWYNIICNKLYCEHISTFLLRLCCDTSVFKRKHPISKLQRPHSAPQSLTNRICRRQDDLFTIIQNVFRCSRTRICWIVQQLLKLNCLQVHWTLPPEWLVLHVQHSERLFRSSNFFSVRRTFYYLTLVTLVRSIAAEVFMEAKTQSNASLVNCEVASGLLGPTFFTIQPWFLFTLIVRPPRETQIQNSVSLPGVSPSLCGEI